MSMEDAYIMAELLGSCKGTDDIVPALRAYDSVRRPRRKEVADSSRLAGKIFLGLSDYGLNPEKMNGEVYKHWDHVLGWSPQQELDRAKSAFEQNKTANYTS